MTQVVNQLVHISDQLALVAADFKRAPTGALATGQMRPGPGVIINVNRGMFFFLAFPPTH